MISAIRRLSARGLLKAFVRGLSAQRLFCAICRISRRRGSLRGPVSYTHLNKPKDDVIVEQVQRILWQVMKKYQLHLNDINFYNLSYHCVIALRRIVGGNQVPQPLLLEQTEGMEREWQAAQEIVACFEEECSIHVEMNETQYIMMHLLGKRCLLYTSRCG